MEQAEELKAFRGIAALGCSPGQKEHALGLENLVESHEMCVQQSRRGDPANEGYD